MRRALLWLLAPAWLLGQGAPVWAPHVPYVPTSAEVADAMLKLAGAGPNDVVYDLGCGDGRIVIAAAAKYGARGVGIDIDADLVRQAGENARRAGVSDRVRFLQGDLFYADFHDATVVTMFLLPYINLKLRPKLLHDLRPGTRLITHSFDMGDWAPEQRSEAGGVSIYRWTVPATRKVNGRIVMTDGGIPPLPVNLERVCGPKTIFEGFSGAEGEFSLALMADPPGQACRLRASLAGYRSDFFAAREQAGNVVLRRVSRSPGSLFSPTTQQASAPARAAFHEGREALRESRPAAGRQAFQKAVEHSPKFAMAWFELAELEKAQGNPDEARKAYLRSAAADPHYVSPYLALVQLAMREDRWNEVAEYSARVIELDPENFPEAWFSHAVASLTMGKFDAAASSARRSLEVDTEREYPRAEYVLGLALAGQGDRPGAAARLAHYLEADPKAPDKASIEKQIQNLQR